MLAVRNHRNASAPFMRTTLRRLRLLFFALRYGVRLLWSTAPHERRVHWIATLVVRLHASPDAREALHRALPLLGPLASAFAAQSVRNPQGLSRSLHEAFDLIARTEKALATALPPDAVLPALRAALPRPPELAFAAIDLVARDSSIGEQAHAARLARAERTTREGRRYDDVTIKLLRVKEIERIGDDIAVLGWVARWLDRCLPAARALQLHTLAQALAVDVQRRFDLRAEAANLSQTGQHFRDDERVVVPDVVWELSSDHALVIEHIETLPVNDLQGLRLRGIDLEQLAERVVEAIIEQAFSRGFFHAALDAERLRVSVEAATFGKLVFGDGKTMTTLSEPEREFFVHGACALFEQEYGQLAAMHRQAGHVAPETRGEVLEAELRTRAEPHFAATIDGRSAAALLQHLLGALEPFDGEVSAALGLAHQALARAESIARTLAPSLDTWAIVKGSLEALAREDAGHRGWIKRLSRELPHLATMPRLPTLLAQRLQHWHEHHEGRDSLVWLAQLRREQLRTRRLLWACALGGVLLGAGAIWLGR